MATRSAPHLGRALLGSLAAAALLVLGIVEVHATTHRPASGERQDAPATLAQPPGGEISAPLPTVSAIPEPTPLVEQLARPHPSFTPLQDQVQQLAQAAGAQVGVTLLELDGPYPQTWSLNGERQFTAASTYKQPLLMLEAQLIATGQASPDDTLCYQEGDWEDGYFSDYDEGRCFSRAELDRRVGQFSDNTAAHILVRYDGGSTALNAYARAHGAVGSAFYYPNTASSDDLARLWADEWVGRAGGPAAQRYLYPLLSGTAYESGIPAGVPRGTVVVHKIGVLDSEVNDSALVQAGPRGAYALVVMTDGVGGDAGWQLVAAVSRAVWSFESTR